MDGWKDIHNIYQSLSVKLENQVIDSVQIESNTNKEQLNTKANKVWAVDAIGAVYTSNQF